MQKVISKKYPLDRRYTALSTGEIIGPSGKILKPALNQGYHYVAIGGKTTKVHRVICRSFHKPKRNMPDVNHKNGIKTDNRPCNLEWSNDKKNIKHAFDTGLRKHIGESNPRTVIPKIHIQIIREAIALKYPIKDIAKYYGVHKNTIYQIKYNVNWSHV